MHYQDPTIKVGLLVVYDEETAIKEWLDASGCRYRGHVGEIVKVEPGSHTTWVQCWWPALSEFGLLTQAKWFKKLKE